MHKRWSAAGIMWLVICLFLAPIAYGFSGGAGTPGNPYRIATRADLRMVGQSGTLNSYFLMVADVNLADGPFSGPVISAATSDSKFNGVFDGDGHKIVNMTISGTTYTGLFGAVGSLGAVRNLDIEGCSITATGNYTGGLAGTSQGLIENCQVSGTITSTGLYVGGLAGQGSFPGRASTATGFKGCHASVAVTGNNYVGGLVGYASSAMRDCSSEGSVTGALEVGGLAGTGGFSSATTGCFSTANVTGTGTATSIGGLVGGLYGTLYHCYSTGQVWGLVNVGGLVGRNEGYVHNSFSSSHVSGGSGAGPIGGLVGTNTKGVGACYSCGQVLGSVVGGGLVGASTGLVSMSFWDMETSGRMTSAGGTGKSTAEMKTTATFSAAGWDMDDETANGTSGYWRVPAGGYPMLVAFDAPWSGIMAGSGTETDPYMVTSAAELGAIWRRPTAFYAMANDISLAGITWHYPAACDFEGVFDGRGHKLTGLNMAGQARGASVAVFGDLASEAVVRNVGIEGCNVVATDNASMASALVASSDGTVASCWATGTVSGGYSGGLVARNVSGNVLNSYFSGTVTGAGYAGGLVAYCTGLASMVSGSYSEGSVSGGTSGRAGGLVGYCEGAIIDCYSTASIGTAGSGGGLTAGSTCGSVSRCYSTGYKGPLIRNPNGSYTVVNSFWDKQTSGTTTGTGGTPLTTIQMMDPNTYLAAGWDFQGNPVNGLRGCWQMPEGGGYPILPHAGKYEPIGLQGSGTAADPFIVTDIAGLAKMWLRPTESFRLANDIDAGGVTWKASIVPAFVGTLDGGRTIRNLVISGSGPFRETFGLVGHLRKGGTIKDIGLDDSTITTTTGNAFLGGIVGRTDGVISECSTGDLTLVCSTSSPAGCILGGPDETFGGMLSNCYGQSGCLAGTTYFDGPRMECCYMASGALWGQNGNTAVTLASFAPGSTDMNTYLAAGWDFAGESANGTAEIWHMPWQATGRPMLWWQRDIPGDQAGAYGVEFADFALLSAGWLQSGCSDDNSWCGWADTNHDGLVDIMDLTIVVNHWLAGR